MNEDSPSLGDSLSSTPTKTGITVSEINNELHSAKITVNAIAREKSPTGPGINANGANASTVVNVEPSSGKPRC